MLKKIINTILITSTIFTVSVSANSDKKIMDFNKETVSEIRKLKVYKNPNWTSKIEFSNGKFAYFSSPKSTFEFYFTKFKWKKFDAKTIDDLENIYVTDFKTHEIIDAKKAYYVYGSRKISPAGDDLASFKTKEDAQKFKNTENGKRIFRFSEVSNGLIKLLNGRM
jgi:nitrous oxide reductase accessory protein NosL